MCLDNTILSGSMFLWASVSKSFCNYSSCLILSLFLWWNSFLWASFFECSSILSNALHCSRDHVFECFWFSYILLEIALTISGVICVCHRTKMLILQFLNNSVEAVKSYWSNLLIHRTFCRVGSKILVEMYLFYPCCN